MKRSVRNGLAIAGMTGGLFFLGQAVASADDGGGGQTNATDQTNSQTTTSEDGGGATGNIGGNTNESENKTEVDVETDVDGGDGGVNDSNVNTGVQGAIIIVVADDEEQEKVLAEYQGTNGSNGGHGADATGVVDIETDSVHVEQNANGGNVEGSGNVADLPKLPDQTNNVHQSNNQSASSEDDDRGRHHGHGNHDNDKPDLESVNGNNSNGGHHDDDGVTGNIGGNHNESENETEIDIDTDVDGGDGGENYSNVNTGLQDVVLKCIAIGGGDAKCIFNITTGSVTVIQNANGGNVTNSGNVGSGDRGREYAGAKPHVGAKPQANAPKHVAPYRAAAPVLSSAQPSGQLAYTGSDVSAPLTVGLLALGAGAGLTLLGRRSAHAA